MSYMDYEDRYVAFLDVLGFAHIVSGLQSDHQSKLMEIYFVLNTARFAEIELGDDHSLRTTSFSDNVVASSAVTAKGLFDLLLFAQSFAWRMLCQGYLCRGAIVKGALYHDKRAVFGKGLVEAYRVETKIADVARVVVANRVVKDMRDLVGTDDLLAELSRHVVRAEDGPYYFNFLMPISITPHRWQVKKPVGEHVGLVRPEEDARYQDSIRRQIREIIERHLDAATDAPSHFAKVKWLAQEFNRWAIGPLPSGHINIYDK